MEYIPSTKLLGGKMKSNPSTLQEIGMSWIVPFEVLGAFLFLTFLLLSVSLSWVGLPHNQVFAELGIATLFVFAFAHHLIFYNLVKCPNCNGKLNKFENGKNVPIKQAQTQLRTGYGCRHCCWKPQTQVDT